MPTTYAADIRPKIRPGDISCMNPRGYSIGDASWMCDAAAGSGYPDHGNARVVYAALAAGDMPPDQPLAAELDRNLRAMDGRRLQFVSGRARGRSP